MGETGEQPRYWGGARRMGGTLRTASARCWLIRRTLLREVYFRSLCRRPVRVSNSDHLHTQIKAGEHNAEPLNVKPFCSKLELEHHGSIIPVNRGGFDLGIVPH
jgi:hypothetical protein